MTIWDEVGKAIKEKYIPITMVLEATRQCNLQCCHCYNIKDNVQLSFDQIKDIGGQLRRAGCLFLVLTGGEVFTKPDFLDIAGYLRKLGFDLKVFTNGTLITSQMVERIKDLAFSEVGISIQGINAQTHDRITGNPGSFAKALSAVKILKQAKVPVGIKTTLMKTNFSEYKEIMELADNLGVTYVIDPVVSPRDDGSKDVLSCRLSDGQLEEFYREQFSKIDSVSAEVNNEDICEAGKIFGSISVLGDVYPCIQIPLKCGNVFQQEFKEIWDNSDILNKMRTVKLCDIEECATCKIAYGCTRCPGLAYLEDGDLFGPSSVACMNARIYEKIKELKI
ncbi:MAG: radical SAM protein [Candidatus Omnitrophota bacterium]